MKKETVFTSYLPEVARWCFVVLAAVIPLWYLPLTLFPVEYNKLFAVVVLSVVGLIAFFATAIQKGSFPFAKIYRILFAYGAFLLILFVASLFSGAPRHSLQGLGMEAGTWLVWVVGGILLAAVPMVFERSEDFFWAGILLLGSFGVIALSFFLRYAMGISLPNTIGGFSSLGVFFGFIVAATLPFLSLALKGSFAWLWSLGIVSFVVALLGVAAVNFFWVWIALGAVAMTFLALALSRARERSLSAGPLVLLLVAVFGILAQRPIALLSVYFEPPLEVRPDVQSTLSVLRSTLRENPFFGVGPNQFGLAWGKFKPEAINSGPFWNIQFTNGVSTVGTVFVEGGVLGGLALLVFLGLFGWRAFKNIGSIMAATGEDASSHAPLVIMLHSAFAGSLFLFLMWFFYPLNLTLIFLSFFTAGFYLALESKLFAERKAINFLAYPRLGFLFSLCMILIMIAGVGLLYFESSRFISHIFYARGIRLFNEGSVNGAEQAVLRAASLEPYQTRYWLPLSEFARIKMQRALTTSLEPQEATRRFQEAFAAAVSYAQSAVRSNPQDGLAWAAFGLIYETTTPVLEGAGELALKHYAKARELIPTDPALLVAESRVHVALAARATREPNKAKEKEAFKNAKTSLEQALILKSDYALANLQLAQLLAQEGDLEKAIARTERAKLLAPNDIGVLFQLGLFYYQNNNEKAAIDQFGRILTLDKNNQQAAEILKNIRAGRIPPVKEEE